MPLLKILYVFAWFTAFMHKQGHGTRFIVAHSLWSDGSIAYLYYLFTGTPYSVAVRNTDINHFIPKLPHYRWLMRRVVANAEKVVFVNGIYLKRIEKVAPKLVGSIRSSTTIYNGIASSWFEPYTNQVKERPPQVCFLGSFFKNKNLKNSVAAIAALRSNDLAVKFCAVGGTEQEFLCVTGLAEVPDWVHIHEKTSEKDVLKRHLSNSRVFLMPSFKETFGLVYIEALSQGCAIVHSKNEGIDGVFQEEFIRSVDPNNVNDIAKQVETLLYQFPHGVNRSDVDRLLPQFDWNLIAQQYLEFIKYHLERQIVE